MDTCFAFEQKYWDGSSDADEETYRRLRGRIDDVRFYDDPQDTECAAWRRMLDSWRRLPRTSDRCCGPHPS
jgi:hypothetical protein